MVDGMARLNRLVIRFADDFAFKLSCWGIVLFPVFLRLPIGLGLRYDLPIRLAMLLPILGVILVQLAYIKTHGLQADPGLKKQFSIALFMLLWIVAMVRTIFNLDPLSAIFISHDLLVLIVVVMLVFFAFCLSSSSSIFLLRRCVVFALGLYISLNLVFYWFGMQSTYGTYLADYPAQMLSVLGISQNRVLFPMTDGINYYGLLSGSVFVCFFFMLWDKEQGPAWLKAACVLVFFLSLLSILMTDSRGALLFSFLTILFVWVLGRQPRMLTILAIVVSLVPLAFASWIPAHQLDVFDALNRPASNWTVEPSMETGKSSCEARLQESSGFLSNRPVIWEVALNELRSPGFVHIGGYGYRSHVVSGLSEDYSCLFKSYARSQLAPTHNLWLQLLLDLGYVGLIVTLVFLYQLISRLSRLFIESEDSVFRSMVAMVVYLILIGSLEASLSPDFNMLFIFICLISVCSMFMSGASPDQRAA
jgi:O-antigen ligase